MLHAENDASVQAHRAVLESASFSGLHIVTSNLHGAVSLHTMPERVALSKLHAFQNIAESCGHANGAFVGSIDSTLTLSINTKYAKPKAPFERKRRRDSAEEQAAEAVARVRKSGQGAEKLSEASYATAQTMVADVLRLRGAHGECVVESWAVSLRAPGEWGAHISDMFCLVVAFRFAAGVAIGLHVLLHALRPCRDGMLTTCTSGVAKDFDLPKSDQGEAALSMGQKSMLLMAAVPNPDSGHAAKAEH